MQKAHVKNTIRYYIVIVIALAFLFFSGDFGLTDVQKTAIVMAVGIDRDEEGSFLVTSQIAVPKSSKQGKQTETVQLVSRGKTVADAFEEINAKTGWYPKLAFCHLIVIGEDAAKQNVFDALDFFMLDEYMSDNCLIATCDGMASELLNVDALIDPSGSVAMQKVLSAHANRVGRVLPSTLREFAIGYYSDSKSSFLPIVKTEPQQEGTNEKTQNGGQNSSQGGTSSGSEASGSGSGGSGGTDKDKPVFSASETALFVEGKRVGKLTKEETFAFNTVKHELQLAAYSVDTQDATCTLTVKRNDRKIKLIPGKDGRAVMRIEVTMSAGLLDYSQALPPEKSEDVGDVPSGVFDLAEKRLKAQIVTAFEKCRACGCDLFGVGERLQKYENEHYDELKPTALENTSAEVKVTFKNVR